MNRILLITSILLSQLISSAQPVLEWSTSFGNTNEDRAYTAINDASGNLYVAGCFTNTVDFNAGSGVNNLVGTIALDAFILKLDSNAAFQWVRGIYGTGNEIIFDIALDTAGNIYVTGYFSGITDFDPSDTGMYNLNAQAHPDVFIAKYDVNGGMIWAHGFGSITNDLANAVEIDLSGNVICSGYFEGTVDFDPSPSTVQNLFSAGNRDIFVSKYTSDGDLIWAKRFGGQGMDIAYGLVCDDANNIYVTGEFSLTADFDPGPDTANLISAGWEDVFVLKLDSAGNYQWAERFGSSSRDYGYNIDLDASNNVHTTGYFNGTVDFDPSDDPGHVCSYASVGLEDAFFSKLDSNGEFIWAKSIGGTSWDGGHAVLTEPSGDILYTGYFSGTVDFDPGLPVYNVTASSPYILSEDIFALKLDASGNFVFALGIGSLNLLDKAYSVLEDSWGNIYLAGCFSGTPDFDPGPVVYPMTSAGLVDIFVAKYNSNIFVGVDHDTDEQDVVTVNPNPFSDHTIISFREEQHNTVIIIRDLLGNTIKTQTVTGKQLVLNRDEMNAGMYFLQMTDNKKKVMCKKIVIQ